MSKYDEKTLFAFQFVYPAFCFSAKFRNLLPELARAYDESILSALRTVESLPGVYAFFDPRGCVYAGKSEQVANRIAQHISTVRPSPWFRRWALASNSKYTLDLLVGVSILYDTDLTAKEHEIIGQLRPRENIA